MTIPLPVTVPGKPWKTTFEIVITSGKTCDGYFKLYYRYLDHFHPYVLLVSFLVGLLYDAWDL
ncbi:MAG TPA: hypothetical protein VN704_10885 [Verrucomicrobiae bacterium]|nr:hypothetical protein [Verrucomicrobiae bacterium]